MKARVPVPQSQLSQQPYRYGADAGAGVGHDPGADGMADAGAAAPDVQLQPLPQYQPPPTIWGTPAPQEAVSRAAAVAQALADVIDRQRLYTTIQGRRHVRVEGWTLLGTLVGVFPVTVWSRPLLDGRGWEARVEARTLSGAVVGAAEAQCSRDEASWRDRPDFALRSMAQTRATSKALRLPLAFVVTMAGYEATPAEEAEVEGAMGPGPHAVPAAPHQVAARGAPGQAQAYGQPRQAQAQGQAQAHAQGQGQGQGHGGVTEPQLRKLWALARSIDFSADDMKQLARERYGVDSVRALTAHQATDFIAFMQQLAEEAAGPSPAPASDHHDRDGQAGPDGEVAP